ncbi:MAG: T9SS type A sorting domain-containing protein [Ignavibacteriaceae bacterium]|nr:T9SS type A sorting domain-containing protein [Ignavibacteriaceae bacterium]
MKNFSLFFVSIALIFFISLCPTYSQTIIPGGYVSGMWTAANSPFQINGDITVHTDSALTIEPGVEVIFQGHYPFIINGILNAVGTQTDSIRFTAAIPDTGWRGLRFMNSAHTSHLAYCIIEYGKATLGSSFHDRRGGGIYVYSSLPPEISHCSIHNNLAEVFGGGICFYNVSNDTIFVTDCDITNNKTTGFSGDGGGIYFYPPNLFVEMQNCIISHNVSTNGNGGGIGFGYLAGSNPVLHLNNCTVDYNYADDEGGGIWIESLILHTLYITQSDISYNTAVNNGGGIHTESIETGGCYTMTFIDSSSFIGNEVTGALGKGGAIYGDLYDWPYIGKTIENTIIADNQAFEGGGLYLFQSNAYFDKCTIADNTGTTGSGLYFSSSNIHIKNSILSLNSPAAIHNDATILYLKYSDFYGNGINISGGVPAGFGQLVTTNYNGDSCDVGYNIFLDPLFEDPGSGNYQITWSNWPTPDSTKSPCIDAGDPTSPLDPDGTITDMGVSSFDQTIPVELVSFSAELIDDNVLLEWITATETNNSGFEIQKKTDDMEWENIGFVQGHGTTTELSIYSYTDDISNIKMKSIAYRLKQIDYNGSYEYSNEVIVENIAPQDFALYQNYPNPFNPVTTIKYNLPLKSQVELIIYNSLGETIRQLVNEEKEAGYHKVEFNATNLPSGVYFYRLKAGNFVETKKMLLLK